MITHELAKKLQDAGYKNYTKCFSPTEDLPNPTLSELIEACGDKHPLYPEYEFCLLLSAKEWCAGYMDSEFDTKLPIGKGLNPEEAVANLCLELNKK